MRLTHAFAVAVLLHVPAAGADVPAAKPPTAAEKEILQFRKDLQRAVVAQDFPTLDKLLAEDFIFNRYDGKTQTKAQWLADLKSGDIVVDGYVDDDIHIRFYGDTSVVTGLVTVKWHHLKENHSGQYRFTEVLVKRDGRWVDVVRQRTKVKGDDMK